MNVFNILKSEIQTVVEKLFNDGKIPSLPNMARMTTEAPKDASFGDVATNVAMVCAGQIGMKPREFAELVVEKMMQLPTVEKAEIAGPGFINLTLSADFWREQLKTILIQKEHYGDSDMGAGEKVNVEFCSVNPTGPLHVGHVRGSVFGDILSGLLSKAGYDVTREYYMNDRGVQMDKLAKTAYLRYREALGEDIGEIPEGCYPGEYMKDVAALIVERDGDKWMSVDESECHLYFRDIACDIIMGFIRKDLEKVGIHFDVFASEKEIANSGGIEKVLSVLKEADLVYTGVLEKPKSAKATDDWTPQEMLIFKSTEFGDEADRPLARADGTYTYFLPDIAYQYNKFERGFKRLIMVLGADHGGYVKRLTSAVNAVTHGQASLEMPLVQMVSFSQNGEQLKMSKRKGTIVLFSDLLDQIDKDVVRFYMATRKADTQLDFDLVKVREQSKDNPVFYVQYAHARAYSVFRKAEAMFGGDILAGLENADLSLLEDADEIALMRLLSSFPKQVETAASVCEPHRIAYYLYDLASAFHALWNKGRDDVKMRFLDENNKALSVARLALINGVTNVISAGLQIFGVEPVKEM